MTQRLVAGVGRWGTIPSDGIVGNSTGQVKREVSNGATTWHGLRVSGQDPHGASSRAATVFGAPSTTSAPVEVAVQFDPYAQALIPRRGGPVSLRSAVVTAVMVLASGCSDSPSEPTTNPTPVLLGASPAMVIVGSDGATITLEGESFVPGSRVRWNAGDRITAYRSSTSLTVRLTVHDLAEVGTGELVVFNPAPGGGLSGVLPLT